MATGDVQYCGLYDTSTTTFTPVGHVIGGTWAMEANAQRRRGIGGKSYIVGGLIIPRLRVQLLPLDGNCWLDKVKRSSYPDGLPPAIADGTTTFIAAGTGSSGVQLGESYIDTARIRCQLEEALNVEYDIAVKGKPGTDAGGRSMDVSAGATFEWYEGVVSIGGNDYNCRSIEFEINNNLRITGSLDSKSSGSKRFADIFEAGREVVVVTAELLTNPGHDVYADTLGEIGTVQLQVTNGTQTITVAIAEAKCVSIEEPFEVDDFVVWRCQYWAEDNSGNLTISIA